MSTPSSVPVARTSVPSGRRALRHAVTLWYSDDFTYPEAYADYRGRERMNRRSYLAGVVGTSALLAGCTSVLDVTEEPTPAENSTDERDDAPFSFGDEPTVVDFNTAPLS